MNGRIDSREQANEICDMEMTAKCRINELYLFWATSPAVSISIRPLSKLE